MPEILNNPWFVSIVCGLIATAIGFGASRLLDNIYNQRLENRIKSANDFTISQFEVYLVNSSNPSYEILVALRCNAARRFNVGVDKLFSVGACIEAVVSGIVSNVYLNADQQKTHLANVSTILSMCEKNYTDDHPRPIPRTALPVTIGVFVAAICVFYLESSVLTTHYRPEKLIVYAVLIAFLYSTVVYITLYLCSVSLFRRKERLYNDTLKRQKPQTLSARESDAGRDDHVQQTHKPTPPASDGEDAPITVCTAPQAGKEDGQETSPEGK